MPHAPNRVTTTRYTVASFVPQFLYLQFHSYMNLYFALVATLQLWPAIAPVPPLTAWLPIIVMLTIAAIKEIAEEVSRWRNDHVRNHQPVTVLAWSEHGSSTETIARELVRPGHIIRMHRGEEAPCDMVALQVQGSDSAEDVWLDTSSVDGESALQRRQVVSECAQLSLDDILKASLTVEPEPPNARMGSFDGVLHWGGASTNSERMWGTSLSHHHLVEQGCRLRLADNLVAIAVYVGADTKASCSSQGQTVKQAGLEKSINGITVQLAVVQLCAVALALFLGWASPTSSVGAPPLGTLSWIVIMPLRMFLLTAPLLPISLRVTVDMTRAWVAHQIATDPALQHCHHHPPPTSSSSSQGGERIQGPIVRSSAVLDDAGRVECAIFDKTGTLTENVMRFQGCVAGGRVLMRDQWVSSRDIILHTSSALGESGEGETHGAKQYEHGRDSAGAAHAVATVLALCHSVAVRRVPLAGEESGEHNTGIVYAGPSPDEETLVEAAARGGVTLEGQIPPTAGMPPRAMVRNCAAEWGSVPHTGQRVLTVPTGRSGGQCTEARILAEIPFSSERKRMSVLVQFVTPAQQGQADSESPIRPDTPVWVLSKGADDVMMRRLRHIGKEDDAGLVEGPSLSGSVFVRDDVQSRSDTMHAIEAFSRRGWRTLVVACRSISPHAAESWIAAWEQTVRDAKVARREAMQTAMAHEIEADLVLLGGTAVEDALQPGAPEMLASLLAGNVRVWMATGDRTTSARQIGTALHLLSPETTVFELTEETTGGEEEEEEEEAGGGEGAARPSNVDAVAGPKNDVMLLHSVSGALRARAGHTSERKAGMTRGTFRRAARRRQAPLLSSSATPSSSSSASAAATDTHHHSSQDDDLLPPPPVARRTVSLADRFFHRAEALSREAHRALRRPGTTSPGDHKCALLVDGVALAWLWDVERDCAVGPLQSLLAQCSPVIACRTVPSQKASLVRAASQLGFRTMAVGDGANDCAMIQEAHVGVGVMGREGTQASRMADIAVPSVAVLPSVLFVHGRATVCRISLIALLSCYKSMLLVALQVAAGAWSGWSGTSFVDPFFLMTFNTLYTAPPLFAMAWFALDANPGALVADPRRYKESQRNVWLSEAVLDRWLIRGVVQAVVILLACWLALPLTASAAEFSTAAFAAMLSTLLITMSLETPRVSYPQLGVTMACYLLYWVMQSIREPGVMVQGWWLAVALGSVSAVLLGPLADCLPSWRSSVGEVEPRGAVVANAGDTWWRRLRRIAFLHFRGGAPRLLPL